MYSFKLSYTSSEIPYRFFFFHFTVDLIEPLSKSEGKKYSGFIKSVEEICELFAENVKCINILFGISNAMGAIASKQDRPEHRSD